jgi:hypothetical protein
MPVLMSDTEGASGFGRVLVIASRLALAAGSARNRTTACGLRALAAN